MNILFTWLIVNIKRKCEIFFISSCIFGDIMQGEWIKISCTRNGFPVSLLADYNFNPNTAKNCLNKFEIIHMASNRSNRKKAK